MREVVSRFKVSDELYKELILPSKQSRRLNSLIVNLLIGYNENPTVRACIDSIDAGLSANDTEDLLAELSKMSGSLDSLLGEAVDVGVGIKNDREVLSDKLEDKDTSGMVSEKEVEGMVSEMVSKQLEELLKGGGNVDLSALLGSGQISAPVTEEVQVVPEPVVAVTEEVVPAPVIEQKPAPVVVTPTVEEEDEEDFSFAISEAEPNSTGDDVEISDEESDALLDGLFSSLNLG